jgi:hypothetical protein
MIWMMLATSMGTMNAAMNAAMSDRSEHQDLLVRTQFD